MIEQSGWIREATHAFTPDAIGDYEITVGARSSADHSVQDAESCADNVKLIQSDHPYAENLNRTWTYSIPGADYLMITFSEDTELELEYDFVILTDANGLEHYYSGNALAGESIYTAGDSVSITLRSDSVYSEYGFEVEEIRAVSAEEYEALPGGELEIVGIHIADSEILVGSTSTVTAVAKGASSQAEYQFVVMRNEETYLTTPWQKANSCALRFDEPGDYCVTASCRDGDKLAECSWYDFFEVMYLFAGSDLFTGDEISWSYKHPQSDVDALKLTFTDSSEMYRNGCTVTITDSFGISQSFNYMDLRNATIAVRGDSFTLSAYASQDSYVDVAICSIVPITLEEYESTYIQPLSMASVRNSNSAPCLNESTVITAMANGGSGSLNYRFSVYLNNNLLSQTDWMTANSHTVTFDQSGRYTFSAEVKDTVTGSTASGSVYGTVWVYPLQSAHFYANNTDETWTWNAPAGQKLWITFSDSTKLEPNFDRLTITDEKGLVGVYTGSELAGQEIAVTGSFSIRLTSDSSTTYYGFAVTDVRAEGESEFDITSAGVLTGYNGSDSSVTIPDSVTAIAASAFVGKDSVTRVTIHSGVTHIEPGAFPKGTVLETQKNLYVLIYAEQNGYECNFSGSLMKLPAALKQIDESAFESTPAACIRLPESIAKIGSRAFADAPSLFMVYIPGSTAEIAEDAFAASEQAIILCTDGSSAHSFAEAQDMKFILID